MAVSAVAVTGVANAIGNKKKSIEDGLNLGKIRAANLGFRFPSYIPGEGNCFMEAIFEQLKVNPRLRHYAESAYHLRKKVCASVFDAISTGYLHLQCKRCAGVVR